MRRLVTGVVVLIASLASGQAKQYPKPQVASAVGQVAPDFTLPDQDGKAVRLADERGHWALLFFYRGYW